MKQFTGPDFKPVQRVDASRDEWARIVNEKHGPCRVTGEVKNVDMAHYVARSQRGDDVPDNVFPLRHDLHMLWHDRGKGWEEIAHAIRHAMTPAEKRYVIAKKSRFWLDKNYPAGDADLCASCRKPKNAVTRLEPAARRKRWSILVPADGEDGAAVLDALVDACAAELLEDLGYEDGTPRYFPLCAVLTDWLQSRQVRRAA